VAAAYDAFAPFYDAFTADYNHDSWMADVEAWARAAGLRGGRVLDVACGTGASFVPLLRRGYDVCACDISPAMVARAREKLDRRGEAVVADMRKLEDAWEVGDWCEGRRWARAPESRSPRRVLEADDAS